MKKLLTLTFIVVMVMSLSAFATNTRVLTLGENNNILIDDANIWLYPSRILNYPNLGIAEIGYTDMGLDGIGAPLLPNTNFDRVGQFGIHWKFGEKNPWVLGTYFYNDDRENFGGDFVGTLLPFRTQLYGRYMYDWFDFPSTPTYNEGNKRFTVFVGHELGGYNWGLKLNAVHSSNTYTSVEGYPDSTSTESIWEYDITLGLTNKAGSWDVAASLYLLGWKDQNQYGYDDWKPKGNYVFNLKGRYFKKMNPTVTFVPNVSLTMGKAEGEYYGYGPTLDYSDKLNVFSLSGGVGMHYTPVQKVLAVMDFGIAYTSAKDTYTPAEGVVEVDKANYFTLPYWRMGLEADVFNWLDLRLGATSYWQRLKEETTEPVANASYDKFNYPDNRTYLGFGLNFNRLHIDTYTDPQLFLHGFNFISGQNDYSNNNDMNFQLSVLYEMF